MSKKRDRKRMIERAWTLFAAILIGTLVLELFMHPHGEFGLEATPFFHAWFGFATCAGIVLASKLLTLLVRRPEDYYKRRDR